MINKEQFKELMNDFAKNKDKEDDVDRDLWAAFQVLDLKDIYLDLTSKQCFFCHTFAQVFDRDGNGYLTRDELELALKMMGEEFDEKDINQFMKATDLDKDDKISFNEFKLKFRMLN